MNLAQTRSWRRSRVELDATSAMWFALSLHGSAERVYSAEYLGEVSGAPRLASGCVAEARAVNPPPQLEQSPHSTSEIWLWNGQIRGDLTQLGLPTCIPATARDGPIGRWRLH